MEERVPASNNDPPLRPSSNDNASPPGVTPKKSTGTYVIKLPRDQVYRIPPPENANIVESHRNPSNDGKKSCGGRLIFTFLAMIVLGIGLFLTVNRFSQPKSPEFSVVHFGCKVSKSAKFPEYEVSLQVFNPNEKSHLHYGAGNVTLNYKGHEIAYGESQTIHQGNGSPIVVDQTLLGTKEALPVEVEKTMKEKDKIPKVLTLKIDVPVELSMWDKSFKKEIIVGCDMEVDSLTQGAKLLTQKCVTS